MVNERRAAHTSALLEAGKECEPEIMASKILGVMALTLMVNYPVRADEPNELDPIRVGSTGIVVGVESCMDTAKKTQPGHTARYYLKHCGCMLDYLRRASGDNNLKFESIASKMDGAGLQEAATSCSSFAKRTEGQQKPVGSPYSANLDLSSEQVVSGFLGCTSAMQKDSTATKRNGFCGCITDAFRSLPKEQLRKLQDRKDQSASSLVPEDKIAYCSKKHDVVDTPSVPSVFVELRSVASGKEDRVPGDVGRRIPVLDSGWSCTLQKPITMHPAAGRTDTIPFDLQLHSLDCFSGDAGVSFSLQCPTTRADFVAYTTARGVKRPAEFVMLVSPISGKQARYAVTLLCE